MLSLLSLAVVVAATPIPTGGYDGYWSPPSTPEKVNLEIFTDLLCDDCKAAWPTMTAVRAHYNSSLIFGLHVFPLPYHRNAFYAAQAARALKSLTQSDAAVWKWAGQLYGDAEPNQNAFLNDATANMTGDAVIAAFASLATRVAGTSAVDFVPKMQWGTKEDGAARASWKYGASRGVTGTPTFLLNGVAVADATPSWTLDDWTKVIDPLLLKAPAYRSS